MHSAKTSTNSDESSRRNQLHVKKILPLFFHECDMGDLIVLVSDMIMQLIEHNVSFFGCRRPLR